MDRQVSLKSYLISSSFVWVAILIASAVILQGTPAFGRLLPVLGGGAVWFVVIFPGALFRQAQIASRRQAQRGG